MNNITCPDCNSGEYFYIGDIIPDDSFAGRIIAEKITKNSLYECRNCSLKYKYPRMSTKFYDTLYDNDQDEVWDSIQLRYDQNRVLSYVNNLEKRNILDYGCYSGGLLAKIDKKHDLYGIEINQKAGRKAHESTGALIFSNISNLPKDKLFDTIITMDVIEHMTSPKNFLQSLLTITNPGGEIIISTGDAENKLWTWHKANWWYCSFNEHISFISESWINYYAPILDFELIEIEKYSYTQITILSILKYIIRLIFIGLGLQEETLQKFFGKNFKKNYIGVGISKDHIFFRLRKKH